MGPGDNSNPGVYFLIGSGTPGVYTRSGVYLDPALKRSYTVYALIMKKKSLLTCMNPEILLKHSSADCKYVLSLLRGSLRPNKCTLIRTQLYFKGTVWHTTVLPVKYTNYKQFHGSCMDSLHANYLKRLDFGGGAKVVDQNVLAARSWLP